MLALVFEHRLEAVDTGVVAGLGVVAFCQQFDGHVADIDGRGCAYDGSGELVLGVLTAVFDLGVESFDLVFVPGALCGGDLLFESSVPSGSAAHAVRGDGCFLESEIDADGLSVRAWLRLDVYVDTEVPVSAGVFGKASGAEGVGVEAVGVPDVEAVAGEADVSVFPCGGAAFEGHPAEGVVASVTVGASPSEPFFPCCFLFFCLVANCCPTSWIVVSPMS